MITQAVVHWLCQFFIWLAGLFPQYHLSQIGGFGDAIADVWVQAQTWSGVIPIHTVLLIFQAALVLAGYFGTVSIVRMVGNFIRGSGA